MEVVVEIVSRELFPVPHRCCMVQLHSAPPVNGAAWDSMVCMHGSRFLSGNPWSFGDGHLDLRGYRITKSFQYHWEEKVAERGGLEAPNTEH